MTRPSPAAVTSYRNDCCAVSPPVSVAVIVTVTLGMALPALGVPLICPVSASRTRPAGKPVWLKSRSSPTSTSLKPVATENAVIATPSCAVRLTRGWATTGASLVLDTVIVNT